MQVLWTDALVYVLVLSSLGAVWYLSRQLHMRRPLRKIANSSVAMISFTILLCYVFIGFADCIHFKDTSSQGNEIISLLDMSVAGLRKNGEKTYSAPFAAYLYNKETITDADGATRWDYPRLAFGGAHLLNPETDKTADICGKILTAISHAAAAWFFIYVGGRFFLARYYPRLIENKTINVIWPTLAIITICSYLLFYLSSYYHVLGTDKVGEDVFYQTLKSIRTGLVIGSLTTLIMLPFAITAGIMAGYFKGWIDDAIQFIYTTLNSIPSVLLIAASILMVQVYMSNHAEHFTNLLVRADMRLLFLCLILGITSWTGLCRLLRAETLKLREMEYVLAARAMGVKPAVILYRHILPNVMHIVLISVVLDFSSLVLAEAVLSYINIGVDPTMLSWGNMINGARFELARDPVVWWSLAAAFVFMFILVLAANLFADSVRDAFDPRRAG
jgi:peptide/nickel transport system permease protein